MVLANDRGVEELSLTTLRCYSSGGSQIIQMSYGKLKYQYALLCVMLSKAGIRQCCKEIVMTISHSIWHA